MKITHIVGNGFDLNIGLSTKYTQFLKYYISKDSNSTSINSFKNHINEDLETWSDFEYRFGSYTAKLESVNDFIELFEDIRDHLQEYLQSELNKFNLDIDESLRTTLLSDLIEPQKYLTLREQLVFENLQRKYTNTSPWNINIVTLNYTEVLDQIIGNNNMYTFKILSKEIGFRIPNVIHLHGNLSERLTFGVNDITQIGNTNFHSDEDVTDTFIKPNFNLALGHLLDEKVTNEIETSNIICLFGTSLGKTDQVWWRMIGDKLKKSHDTYLIYFFKSKQDYPNLSTIEVREKRKIKNNLLEIIGVDLKNDIEEISKKVFVASNTSMLKFNLTRKTTE